MEEAGQVGEKKKKEDARVGLSQSEVAGWMPANLTLPAQLLSARAKAMLKNVRSGLSKKAIFLSLEKHKIKSAVEGQLEEHIKSTA